MTVGQTACAVPIAKRIMFSHLDVYIYNYVVQLHREVKSYCMFSDFLTAVKIIL